MSGMDILDAVKRVVESKQVFNAENTVRLHGPGGEWKIKQYRNARGYLHLNVCAPGVSTPLYSVSAVRDALVGMGSLNGEGDTNCLEVEAFLDEEALDLLEASPSLSREEVTVRRDEYAIRACLRIQTAYRSHILRSVLSHHRSTLEELARVQEALANSTDLVSLAQSSFVVATKSEKTFLSMCGDMPPLLIKYPSVTTSLNSVPYPVSNLLTIMTHPTDLDRGKVEGYATSLMEKHTNRSHIYKTAKAVGMKPHYPLLIGNLPLPSCQVFAYEGRFVRCTDAMAGQHASLLSETFGQRWLSHVSHVMSVRDVRAFDVFADRSLTAHLCSILVSKHLVRVRGEVHPAIHILSMASSARRCGNGTLMMNLCKLLLFADCTSVSKGILFAQCLKVDFWEYRLHEDPRAQAMVLQLKMIHKEYELETGCTMKMVECENVDESAPSPAKALP